MRFKTLAVENLFAYSGRSEVDLSDTSEERNIIIVSGRNGAGKTSLLNAIKLLVLGHDNLELRRVGFGSAPLLAKQYVLGQPGRWFGIFNASSGASVAMVSLSWEEASNEHWEARRTYRRIKGGADFNSELHVTRNGAPLGERDAKAKLASFMPGEIARFFFFDGEQIQSLADAEIGRESGEIERLLGFSFFKELRDRVDSYAKLKQRAGLPHEVQVKIVEAENGAREARVQAEARGRARIQEEETRLDLERSLDRQIADRERLRVGTLTDAERVRIERRIAVLDGQREELALKIAEALPVEIPFLTNPRLVERAFELLNGHLGRATDSSLASRLHRELPIRIVEALGELDPAQTLSPHQISLLSNKLSAILDDFGVRTTPADPLLQSLSQKRTVELRDRFLLWSEKGGADRLSQRDDLLQMRRLTSELRQVTQELDEAELTTESARTQYSELSDQISLTKSELSAAIERITTLGIQEQQLLRQMQDHERRIADLEQEAEEVGRENAAYQLALRIKRALDRYRELRRQQVRASIESRLNERVAILLAPSQLIHSVKLDEDFIMSYFDQQGRAVPRLSISAGMRQLLAMAMLWALKDESNRPMPVMIDTPLGRIDRTNRSLLMDFYFPYAGNPLVLLPTDTELGSEDLDALAPHIRRRYRIENNDGDNARIIHENAA